MPHGGEMNHGRTVLAQVLDGLDAKEFCRCAARHPMVRETPALSGYDHFAVMIFAQLTYREGLRDIEACLGSRPRLLYHSGIRGTVKRCNLAYANEHRSAALFAEIARVLMRRAKRRLELPGSLHQTLQIISISALEKLPLHQLFEKNDTTNESLDTGIQMEINGWF